MDLRAMFGNLTLNSVMWMLIGLVCFGAAFVEYRAMRVIAMAIGLVAIGIGCILCGMTNGFSSFTPVGQVMRKVGTLSFLLGVPLTGYYVYLYFLR